MTITETESVEEKVSRLRRHFPIQYVDRDDVSEYGRWVGPFALSDTISESRLPFVDLGSVAAGADYYDQTSTCNRSNYRVLHAEDDSREENGEPRRWTDISYRNVNSLGAFISDLSLDDIDMLVELAAEYPVLDESDMSDLEEEEITESWDQYLRSDVNYALSKIMEDDAGDGDPPWYTEWENLSEDEQQALWFEAVEATGNYAEHTGIEVLWSDWESETAPALVKLLKQRVDPDVYAEDYDALLDDCYPTIKFGDLEYSPSHVLREVDPIAYREGLLDYINQLEEDDNEEESGDEYHPEPPC